MNRAELLRFRTDIAAGRGRALVAVRRSRGRGLEAEIDRACMNALAFDPQCEGSRAEWLYEIASLGGRLDELRARWLRSLRRTQSQRHSWTLLQRLELAALHAERGDRDSRDAVIEFVRRNADEFSGFADDALRRAAGLPLAPERPRQRPKRTRPKRLRWSARELEQILAGRQRMSRISISRWGRTASKRELASLDRRIASERDEQVLERLFAAFRERPMKHGVERALAEARRGTSSLAERALEALAQVDDPRARELAERTLDSGSIALAPEAIRILARRPVAADWPRTARVLERARSIDAVHAIGGALLDWSRAAPRPQRERALAWIWERTPCSQCRENALRQMRRRSPSVLREARTDASPAIRALAKQRS